MHVMRVQVDQPRSDAIVAAHAARQFGVVSRRQLVDAGLTRSAIEHRLRIGWLHRMYRGVYAVGHPPLMREARWMGAVLACGDDAGLSHACATALWEIRPYSGTWIDVTVPTRAGRKKRDGLRIHRCGTLTAEEITTHRAIRVTSVARTLLDVAAMLTPPALARTVEQTEIRRLFDLAAVERTIALNPKHRGVGRLRDAIALYRPDELKRSDLEHAFLALCHTHGLPRPLVNHLVEGKEVDFLWPDHRLIVETDGAGTHLTRAAFHGDRARDARLLVLGYRVLRFTDLQVTRPGSTVGATVRTVLAQPTSGAR